jgi:transcriptional regulator with XRE-family HTH domain
VSADTTTPPVNRIAEIRAELDAIAPMPEERPVTAGQLAAHFAVRAAQREWLALNGSGDEGLDPVRIAALGAEFAAAHALYAFHAGAHAGPELGLGIPPAVAEGLRGCTPDEAAVQIRDAVCDGDGIGEWLWEHLGEETARKVSGLMEQLDAAVKAAKGGSEPGSTWPAEWTAVGHRIREARQSAGLTQAQLGELLDVTQTAVSYWESGKREPGVADLVRIAAQLGVPAASLLPPDLHAPAEPEPAPVGRLARVEVKGFRDLGIVRVTESTLAGEPMLRAEGADGAVAEFPASSLHFITWLPEGAALTPAPRAAIPSGWGADDDDTDDYDDEEHPF